MEPNSTQTGRLTSAAIDARDFQCARGRTVRCAHTCPKATLVAIPGCSEASGVRVGSMRFVSGCPFGCFLRISMDGKGRWMGTPLFHSWQPPAAL